MPSLSRRCFLQKASAFTAGFLGLRAYLASPAAGWISGQVFSVYGDRLHLNKGWHTVATIEKPGAGWTAEEYVAAIPKLAGMAPVSMIEQLTG